MSQRRNPTSIALSQHRLRTAAVAERISASTGPAPPALVYDWGAGAGALTAVLLRRAHRVVAVERDRSEWIKLRRRFAGDKNLTAVLGDFRREPLPGRVPYSVVANLPYSLSSDAMRTLLRAPHPPTSAHLIMQRETAFRWLGIGRKTEVSILARVRAAAEVTLALHRREFSPRPNVDSVLIRLEFRERPLFHGREEAAFAAFVGRGLVAAERN